MNFMDRTGKKSSGNLGQKFLSEQEQWVPKDLLAMEGG